MSLFAIAEAWDKSRADGATLLILLAIADYADTEGISYPSEAHLAAKGRISERSIRRHIARLRELGELETWEWFDKAKRKRNCYRVLVGDFDSFRGIEPEEIRKKATILRLQIPTATRRAVFEHDGWKCVRCGSRELLTIDHIVPVSQGGGSEIENLQTLCRACNSRKSDRTDSPVSDRTPTAAPDRTPTAAPARARSSYELEPPKEPLIGRVPAKVDRKTVTKAEGELAVAVLAEWNRQTGQRLGSKDWIAKIVMRIRDHPDLGIDEHAHVIAAALAKPWWDGPASPSVVYGNGSQFERSILTVTAPAASGAPARFGRGLSTKQTAELFGIGDELP